MKKTIFDRSIIGYLGSPPLWRMACCSSHLVVNLGLGTAIRYHRLTPTTTLPFIHSYTRASLGYADCDLLSTMALSPQLILAINVELANNRHVVDLFSISNSEKFHPLKRIHSNNPCPLDVITSLRDCTWLCKSHWPSDDCLCLIESNGLVKKLPIEDQHGYVLNLRISTDRSYLVLIRTPNKLPKEIDITELNRIDQNDEDEQHQPSTQRRGRKTIGRLPGNLLLEIYRIS